MPGPNTGTNRRLDSWKEIAGYLRRNQRTVIRWEKEKQLPVRRVPGGKRQTVFAYTRELDAWLKHEEGQPQTLKPAIPYRPLALAALLLLVALPIARLISPKRTPHAATVTPPAALPPLDPRHIILSQNFDRMRFRTEAFFDDRTITPKRNPDLYAWRNMPTQVRGLADVTAMAGGWGETLAVKSDGTLWTWGLEYLGEDRPALKRLTPIEVRPILPTRFRAVAAGEHSLALATDGTVWAWGSNDVSGLGDGTTIPRNAPVRISIAGVADIAACDQYSLALRQDGTVWIWGGDLSSRTVISKVPAQVPGLEDITSISAGAGFFLALKKDGTVWARGNNRTGSLGDGTNKDRQTPALIPGLSDIKAIAAGAHHAAALKNDGTVWAWGQNSYGELGDGTTTDHWSPTPVSGLDNVTAIAAGAQHTFALRSDGTVWAWGQNYYGVLGDGTFQNRSTPKPVRGLSDVIAIAAGGQHALARKVDGTLWTWGWNEYGQLGEPAVRELENTGTTVKTINYASSSGPTYSLPDSGLPWILFDGAARRILLQPGKSTTSHWGAAVGHNVPADGLYSINGAFQRANSFLGSGAGVDASIFVDGDDAHPLWRKHIDSSDTTRKPFSLVAELRRGQTVRFVVFGAPKGKAGDSDETSLEASIDLQADQLARTTP